MPVRATSGLGCLGLSVLVAVAIYLISGGHVLFLPLLFVLPLGLFSFRRRRR
jgi:hypothetical protein